MPPIWPRLLRPASMCYTLSLARERCQLKVLCRVTKRRYWTTTATVRRTGRRPFGGQPLHSRNPERKTTQQRDALPPVQIAAFRDRAGNMRVFIVRAIRETARIVLSATERKGADDAPRLTLRVSSRVASYPALRARLFRLLRNRLLALVFVLALQEWDAPESKFLFNSKGKHAASVLCHCTAPSRHTTGMTGHVDNSLNPFGNDDLLEGSATGLHANLRQSTCKRQRNVPGNECFATNPRRAGNRPGSRARYRVSGVPGRPMFATNRLHPSSEATRRPGRRFGMIGVRRER